MPGPTTSLLRLSAADLMTAPVTKIPQDMSLRDAARLLGVLSSSDFVTWAGKDGTEEVSFIAPWARSSASTATPTTRSPTT